MDSKIKIINEAPKYKYIRYEDEILYVGNNMDNDVLNESSEFMIGSITKVLMIVTLLILQEKKQVKLNDTINNYVIKSTNQKNNDCFAKTKIIDLINHKSGMKRMPSVDDVRFRFNKFTDASEIVKSFIDEELFIDYDKKAGVYDYSNIGYIVLGSIIEKISDLDYVSTCYKFVLQPLRMFNTRVGETNIELYNHKGEHLTNEEFVERYFASSAGAFYTTALDFVRFSKGLFSLLNKDSLEILESTYIHRLATDDNNNHILAHNGGIPGGLSELGIIYEHDDSGIRVKNTFFRFMAVPM